MSWTVVVPVKAPAVGKSRLDMPGADRAALAHAIALDTVAAAAAALLVQRVIVVTDDAAVTAAVNGAGYAGHGTTTMPGPCGDTATLPGPYGGTVSAAPGAATNTGRPGDGERGGIPGAEAIPEGGAPGLNAAIAHGLAAAGRGPRAVLLGDLPALRPADLDDALRRASDLPLAAVADAEGTGTTLVTAAPGIRLVPSFGEGSFARHLAAGCVALAVPADSTLCRDVDTAAQLAVAATLGLGPRTAALLHPADGWSGPAHPPGQVQEPPL